MINSLLTFGAKSVKPEILEKTLTVRKKTVNEIEKNCVNKILNSSTWQSLIISPRGSGKTHIIKVLYHRLKNNKKISDKSVIAYMSEDEVGISNFTDLLVSIIRAFVRYNEVGSETLETQISEASLIKDSNKREIFVKDILIRFANKRIIILLIENFDKILNYIGSQGQRSLRDFIHQYNNLSIIATSQNLIANLQDSKSSFYNFFNIFQLEKLNFNGTIKFLSAIAKTEDNKKLADDIYKPEFEGKLRAIYELTEGNHRLLVTFYSFLKADFKSELSGIFIKVMNDLKPYYEQFVNVLPTQQQKIVKHLSLNREAISGKEIARACFIEPNVFSKQISLLYERGMIDKNKSGKDVFYELKEPLMRICFEISENPNGISKLFVDFLSTYYDRPILREKYLKYRYGARFQCKEIKHKYENEALIYGMALNEPEREKISFAHKVFDKIDNYVELDNMLHSNDTNTLKQIDLSFEYFKEGNDFIEKNQYNKALDSFQKAIKINPDSDKIFFQIGFVFSNLKKHKEAIKSYQKAIEIKPDKDAAYYNMGIAYSNLKQYKEAIISYQKAIEIRPEKDAAYYNMGIAYDNLKQYKEAIKSYQKAIEIKPDKDEAYYNMGIAFSNLKQYEKAIKSYQRAVELKPDNDSIYNGLGLVFLKVNKTDNAFEAFHKGLEINPENKYTNLSLLGAYIRINDQNKSKELMINLINKVENDLLTISLTEDVFYNLFRFGSDAFIKSYFDFLLKLMFKEKKDSQLWKALPDSLFDILINIEDYDKERLDNIEKALSVLLAEHEESIIPLKMFSIGVAYLKNKDKNAIFKLSKEERKLFKEAVLDKIGGY